MQPAAQQQRRFTIILAVTAVALATSVSDSSPPTRKLSKSVKVDATATKIDADSKQVVTVTLDIEKDWHIYANPVKNQDFTSEQTVVRVASDVKLAALEVKYPAGKLYEIFPRFSLMIYEGKISIQAIVQRTPGDASPLKVEVRYRPINIQRGVCVWPESVQLTLP